MTPLTPSKIVCVGRNYVAHARELGNEAPAEPLLFLKPPSALLSSGEPILMPPGMGRVDFEGEIGVIVGRQTRNVREEDALAHLSAIVAANDVTCRDLQRTDGQWTRAKGFDTFCPVGTPRPIEEVRLDELRVQSRVNGELRQDAPLSDVVFSVPFLLAYISRIMTLEPGDLILTGTPQGVGPLVPGDEVEIEIPGVSRVRNPVREATP